LRLPRDVSGDDLAKALSDLGYRVTRQTGSHLRLTTFEGGEHHVTIPPSHGATSWDAGGRIPAASAPGTSSGRQDHVGQGRRERIAGRPAAADPLVSHVAPSAGAPLLGPRPRAGPLYCIAATCGRARATSSAETQCRQGHDFRVGEHHVTPILEGFISRFMGVVPLQTHRRTSVFGVIPGL
jgi:predicted RNA binding protein YcfA (HicA-like mRNA interferase family)